MEPCICCASVTMVPTLARTPSIRKNCEQRSTPAAGGILPPSNRTEFRQDTTTTAHRLGSQPLNGSRHSWRLQTIALPEATVARSEELREIGRASCRERV